MTFALNFGTMEVLNFPQAKKSSLIFDIITMHGF